ncbi:hypothetical protein ACOMHN_007843 [Nucella lapillus]
MRSASLVRRNRTNPCRTSAPPFRAEKNAGKAACRPTFPKVGQSRRDAGKAACGPTFPKVGQSRRDAGKAACGPTFPKVGQSRKDAGKAACGPTSPKTGRSPKEPQMFGLGRPESRGPQGETNGGLKPAAKTEPQLLRVNRVCASSSGVKIVVGGLPVEAKIDSGAEITILSTTAFEKLREKPKMLREVNMQLADQGSTMRGFITRPVGLKIGGMTFHEQVHVAPISDQMLLGHDLLHHWGVIHDMGTNTLLIGNERIPLNMNVRNSIPTVGRVTAARRAVIPPNSVVRLSGKLDTTLGDYYIEPVDASHLFIPRTVRKADECPVVCLVNLSDQYHTGDRIHNANHGKSTGTSAAARGGLKRLPNKGPKKRTWETAERIRRCVRKT